MDQAAGILLTRSWRDGPRGLACELWAATDAGPVCALIEGREPVCFIDRGASSASAGRREPVDLKALDTGAPVDALYFTREGDLRAFRVRYRERARLYEADLSPVDRFLMERFVKGTVAFEGIGAAERGYRLFRNPAVRAGDAVPELRTVSVDIETAGLTGELYSIACAGAGGDAVWMVGEGRDADGVRYVPDEREALRRFLAHVAASDPDVLVGWNFVDFDLKFLEVIGKRYGIPLTLGRGGGVCRILPPAVRRQASRASMPGRVALDGIAVMRAAAYGFEQFSLEHVANAVLGRGKLIDGRGDKLAEIRRLFREDKPALAAYNLEDCRLVLEIFDATRLLDFAVQRSRMTGLPLDRQGGSVAAFEYQYLPRLHRAGYVAPDAGAVDEPAASPGGYILDSQPGLYRNVLVFDFKSLYPSIIRTFNVDPVAMVEPGGDPIEGFRGARFARKPGILPGLIESLWDERENAKRSGNAPLSTAIKIMMNSFYGVLGTPACRFCHPSLVESITRRGHEIIRRSRDWFEAAGYRVLYGDTDSLFVHLGDDRGEAECGHIGAVLRNQLNAWWRRTLRDEHRVESFLEIQFETHFLRFFMPTVRGSGSGSKKRYAGLVRSEDGTEIVIKGLEAVRTDWTPLARRFQRELLRRVFADEALEEYIRDVAAAVAAGRHDQDLVYTKRLRRDVEEYTKNVPPHVQAARQLERPGRRVSYAVTVHGPQPIQKLQSPLDYAHYLDRQLAPVADTILRFFDTSFAEITAAQLEMFRD